jgi:phospholipid/cholesterol/gamma-HCH transport system substrate-binding protein
MDERRMQFRVGVVVFATMIVGAVLTTLYSPLAIGFLPWGHSTYRVGIKLPQAPGIGPNTPVRKNGILIGRVEEIEDQDDGVIVQAKVEADRPLHTGHVPHVRTTVLGDATIDFVTSPTGVPPQPLSDGVVIPGVVDPHPLDSIAKLGDLQEEFAAASRALTRAGNEVGDLAERVNKAFGDETEEGRVTRLLDTTEQAMRQFSHTMTAMNEIIGDEPAVARQPAIEQPPTNRQPPLNERPPIHGQPPAVGQPPIEGPEMRQRLRESLNEMPNAVREARITMQQFRDTLELANRNLRNLEGFTEPLGEKGGEIAGSLIKAVEGLDSLVTDFSELTRALNNREGTIGRLIHDARVYENLNALICNANTVLEQVYQITARLKPVVEDARVFMDKVAREPGRIVTGALSTTPSITK